LVRHQVAVLALLTVALASSFWVLLDVAGDYSQSSTSFGVASFENRFSALRKMVTPQSVFGYTSDNPPNDPSDQAEFYLTQYTLAPAIITSSILENQVIVNFHSPKPNLRALQAKRLMVVQDFGSGILLCRPIPSR
jgi:hypothetical protein